MTKSAIACHQIFVVQLALGDDAHLAQPLDDEAMPLVERFGAGVLGKNGQLDAAKHQPVVGDIEQRFEQTRADALTLRLAGDEEKDVAAMPHPSTENVH